MPTKVGPPVYLAFVPDLPTFEALAGHDSIEFDSDALDARDKEHNTRCRLDVYYMPVSPPQLQRLSLEVMRYSGRSKAGNSIASACSSAFERRPIAVKLLGLFVWVGDPCHEHWRTHKGR
jgi:hypothetical protein